MGGSSDKFGLFLPAFFQGSDHSSGKEPGTDTQSQNCQKSCAGASAKLLSRQQPASLEKRVPCAEKQERINSLRSNREAEDYDIKIHSS
mgnify:CR=1 FL=1